MYRSLSLFAGGLLLSGASASGVLVSITLENLQTTSPTGLYNSPVWLGFHDGSFDLFNSGEAASSAIQNLAELADPTDLETAFSGVSGGVSTVVADPEGFNGAIFRPGSIETVIMDLDVSLNRFLSFGSMVVPSNDSFIGNGDPMSLEIFDGSGNFTGGMWTLTDGDIWDSGTEMNDLTTSGGAAFVDGADAMMGVDEGGLVHLQTPSGLDPNGVMTPDSTTIGVSLTGADLFRISVTAVPEPSAFAFLIGMTALGLAVRRRR